ncbi:MAG: ABC transporter permease, partial [Prevotella sp.]|nr:ABC transporter permease [Prevotella sp.]
MNLPLYIARRIYGDEGDRRKVSRPAIRIATIGVAIGLAVMIVTVAVVLGFKHTIRDKVVGFGSHIQIMNTLATTPVTDHNVCLDDTLMKVLADIGGVRHVARFAMAQGILKTDDDFLGVTLKGVGPEYDTTFLKDCLVEGELPQFCDTATNYPLVISQTMASKLRLSAGDRVFAYFVGDDDVRTRRFTITGIYQTNMKRFDDLVCITDLYVAQKLNGWRTDQCTGGELLVDDFDRLEETNWRVLELLRFLPDRQGNRLAPQAITDIYPQVFSWL